MYGPYIYTYIISIYIYIYTHEYDTTHNTHLKPCRSSGSMLCRFSEACFQWPQLLGQSTHKLGVHTRGYIRSGRLGRLPKALWKTPVASCQMDNYYEMIQKANRHVATSPRCVFKCCIFFSAASPFSVAQKALFTNTHSCR